MGRPQAEIDIDRLLDMCQTGVPQKEMAKELGVTPPTLAKRIAELQEKQGLLLQYRAIQSLQLTSIQARVLEAITPERIDGASLRDLVYAFKVLKDKEQDITGGGPEMKGLLAHLLALEKEELAAKMKIELAECADAEYEDVEGRIPELTEGENLD